MIPGLKSLNGLDPEVLGMVQRIFHEQSVAQAVASERRLAAVGRLNRRDSVSLNGVGSVKHRFDAEHFFMTAALQGANLRDPDFKPWLAKREDGDYARVRCRGTRIQVGFTGADATEYREPKFRKRYA